LIHFQIRPMSPGRRSLGCAGRVIEK
jgi:hypothetical protein